ncbi:MAG: hypothetical protein JNL32_00960 [Candidatus Kapabacteria bacterium]|nr:hypothetical protein [Candidatus Kapabacteria bacterium]
MEKYDAHSSIITNEDYEIARFSRAAEEERLQQEFCDYAVVPAITGRNRSVQRGSMVPSEFVDNTVGKVAIMSTESIHSGTIDHDHPMTVLLHRDEYTDIRSIEILCSCGKRAVITLEYDGDELVAPETIQAGDGMHPSITDEL